MYFLLVVVFEFIFDRKAMRITEASDDIQQITLEAREIVHIFSYTIDVFNLVIIIYIIYI